MFNGVQVWIRRDWVSRCHGHAFSASTDVGFDLYLSKILPLRLSKDFTLHVVNVWISTIPGEIGLIVHVRAGSRSP